MWCPINTEDAQLLYAPKILEDDSYFTLAQQLTLQSKPEVMVFGKVVRQQRDVQFFSNKVKAYKYAGRDSVSAPLPDWLNELMGSINQKFQTNFNSVLVNRYNNGEEYVGSHSDDESALVPGSPVASLSLGATRTFRIRNSTGIVLDLPLNSGDFVMMMGSFQKQYKHEIPKQLKVKEPRVSLTFREHIG